VSTDPTAYYNDFWRYASYYGEAAARAYYTAWSPPEGTPPPEGIILPATEGSYPSSAEPLAAATSQTTESTSGVTPSVDAPGETSQDGTQPQMTEEEQKVFFFILI
jgi:hypothetical protein